MRMLVGDIGGTKTVLAIAEQKDDRVQIEHERRYTSGDFSALEDIVQAYTAEVEPHCTSGAFAVAGPVSAGRSQTTNLPWDIDARQIETQLGFDQVQLLNDLEAVAWGVDGLPNDALATLHEGEAGALGNACVIAAGTGLGQAGMYWDGKLHHPFATEGGHTDFAPRDERDFALYKHLAARHGRVSWERLVSGMGIANLYYFLIEWRNISVPAWLEKAIGEGDASAVIAREAAAGNDETCVETMNWFASLYGREAGNLALKHMALGGVFIGGGIAPKNLDLLRGPEFLEAFLDKGRMTPLMRRIPIRVILDQHVALIGAARFIENAGD